MSDHFITEKVPVYFRDKKNTSNEGADIYWSVQEEWRKWGLKDMIPIIKKVVVFYEIEKDDKVKYYTDIFTENIKYDNTDRIPFYPTEVRVKNNKVTVSFG